MIFCLNNFHTASISKVETLPKYGKKIIKMNIYQCLVINKDTIMNQQSKYEKILS